MESKTTRIGDHDIHLIDLRPWRQKIVVKTIFAGWSESYRETTTDRDEAEQWYQSEIQMCRKAEEQ